MSKSKHKKYDDWYETDEDFSFTKQREENKNRRKMKRMKAALKTRDIDTLLRYEEDEL